MIILTLRTDKPEAEIGLYENSRQLAYEKWQAHRQLAETLHTKIHNVLNNQKLDWQDLQGVVVYSGPGSFTGLRIGLAVANALAAGGKIPIAGSSGEEWLKTGIDNLLEGAGETVVLPDYGAPVHITAQKK